MKSGKNLRVTTGDCLQPLGWSNTESAGTEEKPSMGCSGYAAVEMGAGPDMNNENRQDFLSIKQGSNILLVALRDRPRCGVMVA